MTGSVIETVEVTPARQRNRLRTPALAAVSASPMAQPKLLRQSLLNGSTAPVPPFTPRMTSSTASTPDAGVPVPTTVTSIWRQGAVISPSWPALLGSRYIHPRSPVGPRL